MYINLYLFAAHSVN